MNKFQMQENQYKFPYHYLPHIDENGIPLRSRHLRWGYKYLCYLMHIKEIIETLQPQSVIEVGCGEGRFIGMLNDKIKRKVGTDLAERPIMFAKAFNSNVDFHAIDAKDMNEKFDVVTAIEVLEHIPDEEVNEFFNILADRANTDGHVVISTPTTVLKLNKKHYRHYTADLFREQLKKSNAKLEIVNIDYIYRKSLFTNLYFRLTRTKFWFIEIHFLNKIIWNYIWNNLRKTNSNNGEDLVVTLRKLS